MGKGLMADISRERMATVAVANWAQHAGINRAIRALEKGDVQSALRTLQAVAGAGITAVGQLNHYTAADSDEILAEAERYLERG